MDSIESGRSRSVPFYINFYQATLLLPETRGYNVSLFFMLMKNRQHDPYSAANLKLLKAKLHYESHVKQPNMIAPSLFILLKLAASSQKTSFLKRIFMFLLICRQHATKEYINEAY